MERALALARANDVVPARAEFEAYLAQHPAECKAWISYAQMERRCGSTPRCRAILRRGLATNPESGHLRLALGLHEMQRNNGALGMSYMHQAVDTDPDLAPVLRWQRWKDLLAQKESEEEPPPEPR